VRHCRLQTLTQLINGGANLARFNFSHGTVASHTEMLGRLRRVCGQAGRNVAIMVDLEGSAVRSSYLIDWSTKERIKQVELQVGGGRRLAGWGGCQGWACGRYGAVRSGGG
jgi:pyruvate kinase